jgi:hypothetical protein
MARRRETQEERETLDCDDIRARSPLMEESGANCTAIKMINKVFAAASLNYRELTHATRQMSFILSSFRRTY